jgi:hypothetical protein
MYGRSKLDTDGDVAASSGNESEEDEMKNSSQIKSEPIERDGAGASTSSANANDDEHVTLDLLKSFSKKEKKLLLKRLIHLERKKST